VTKSMTATVSRGSVAEPAQPRSVNVSLVWSAIGLGFVVLELFVVGRWVTGPHFGRPAVNAGSVPDLTRTVILVTQVISPIVTAMIVVKFLVLPWIRQRRLTFDGMLLIAWFGLWFQDPMGNFITPQLYYSSYWYSFGSWTLGSTPGWVSPAGNHLPEPIFVMGFGYLWLGFSASVFACWAMRKCRNRFPRTSGVELVLLALVICVALDVVAEVALAWAGTFAWPAAIDGLTLFYGKPYQFPMYEGILFGGTFAAAAALRFYRDDRGTSWVERGIDRLDVPQRGKTALRFLSIYGFLHLFMAVVYSLPMMLLSVETDNYLRYPSHLENGMCVSGPNFDQCPGPGVPLRRPPFTTP
jgi:Spirocyclase AveC-like